MLLGNRFPRIDEKTGEGGRQVLGIGGRKGVLIILTDTLHIIIADVAAKMDKLKQGVSFGVITMGQTAVKEKAFIFMSLVTASFVVQVHAAFFYEYEKIGFVEFIVSPPDAVQRVAVEQSTVIVVKKLFQRRRTGGMKMHQGISVYAFFPVKLLITHGRVLLFLHHKGNIPESQGWGLQQTEQLSSQKCCAILKTESFWKGEKVMAYDHGAFRVSNLEESVRFYTEKLGFQKLFSVDSEEFGEKGMFLEYNGARLELIETIGVSYQPVVPERPYCPHLCFEAEDMDEVISMLKKNDIRILDGPNEIPGSERWIYFTDPDGNVLEYIVWLDKNKTEKK